MVTFCQIYIIKIYYYILKNFIIMAKKNNKPIQLSLFPEMESDEAKLQRLELKHEELAQQNRKLQKENEALQKQVAELEKNNASLLKKAKAFDDLMQSSTLFPIGVIAKNFGFSAIALNKYLHEKGIQFSDAGVWKLYAKYQKSGYTRYCWFKYSEDLKGRPKSRAHMYWTAKGLNFIRDLLIADGLFED